MIYLLESLKPCKAKLTIYCIIGGGGPLKIPFELFPVQYVIGFGDRDEITFR